MKKVVLVIIAAVIVLVGVFAIYYLSQNKDDNKTNNENFETSEDIENTENSNYINNDTLNESKKYLVVYYSAQNHTRNVAKKIAENLNADIFEILPKAEYTSEDLNWNNENSRVSKEHANESLRNVELKATKVNNWESYDTVIIAYPIWWSIAAWPVNTFVKANDFSNKTVIPVCTSASSGIGQSGKLLEKEVNSGKWLEGHRFSSNATDVEITKWTDSLINL